MASFDSGAFFTDSFSVNAFDFGGVVPPAPVTPPSFPIGGGIPYPEKRSKQDISRARRRLGLEDEESLKETEAQRVILEVAQQQAQRLELDKQKQFEELSRELRLRNIEWEGRYLETLNLERERLIEAEISARLKAKLKQQQEDDEIVAILIGLAANL